MKMRTWMMVAAAGVGVVAFGRSCKVRVTRQAPDERIAGHIDDLCDIARDNVKTPVAGVRAMGDFLDKHLGDVTGDWGELISTIERIPDDRAHDERARDARDLLHEHAIACARDFQRFGEAVESDPTASRIVQRASDRLGRTLEIISGSRGDGAESTSLHDLPSALVRAVDSLGR